MYISHIKTSHTKRATRNGFVLVMGKPRVGMSKSPDWYKRDDGLVLQQKCDNLQMKLILAAISVHAAIIFTKPRPYNVQKFFRL